MATAATMPLMPPPTMRIFCLLLMVSPPFPLCSALDLLAAGIKEGHVHSHRLFVSSGRWLWERFAWGGRERLHHRVGHPKVAVPGSRALRGHPFDRLPVGDVVTVAAGVQFDAHATGLAKV